jgi:hypothetical protein
VVEAAVREKYFQEDSRQIVAWDRERSSKKNHLSRWRHWKTAVVQAFYSQNPLWNLPCWKDDQKER